MMYERSIRGIFAILVVLAHLIFVFFCAVYLQSRITKFETYLSTLAVFLPVFGVYVAVVVKNIEVRNSERGAKVNPVFLTILVLLFVGYCLGNAAVIGGYAAGVVVSEDLLPGAIAAVETAFGGFFTTLFLKLYGEAEAKV